MRSITKEKVIIFHEKLIERFGGSRGIRDENMLDSTLVSAFQTFNGNDLYKTDIDKIASICYSLILNHSFIDGNKRIGIFVMLILLKFNFYEMKYTQKELIELGFEIARGNCKRDDIKKWIENHLK